MKRFACQDIIPGCSHVFTGADDQSVLDQVIAHAAQDHGLVKPPLALVELVVATTYSFTPARPRGHLRLVGSESASTADEAPVARTGAAHARADEPVTALPSAADPWQRIAPAIPFQRRRQAVGTDVGAHTAVFRPPAATIDEPAIASRPAKYRHECLFYSGADGFLAGVVPFIRDGLALGEPVMVAIAEPRLTAVREALGEEAKQVILLDMAQLGGNPASIIPAWRDFIAGTDGKPIRGVGEPIWAGRRDVEIVECQLHEALLNIAVDHETPLWLMCPYDVTALDEDIIAEARRSHSPGHLANTPVRPESAPDGTPADRITLVATAADRPAEEDSAEDGAAADGPADSEDHHLSHALSLFAGDLPEPVTPSITVLIPHGLDDDVVTRVFDAANAAGLPAQRSAKLAAAVDEVVYAGTRNSGAAVSLRLWRDPAALVCEVGDHGVVTDLLVGRGPALSSQSRDRGIRLANELCDLVQVRSNGAGTTVRMHSWL